MSRLIAAWMTVAALPAFEYHGTVKAGGLPLPGAAMVAAQGEKKLTTTTDEKGLFRFPDLAEGEWTVEVEALGFAKQTRQISAASAAAALDWDLRFLSEQELTAAASPAVPSQPAAPPRREVASPQSQTGFRRLDVNQSSDAGTLSGEGALKNEEMADLSQRAANSFLVQGSTSSALGLPQQNDWAFGPRGPGMDPMGGPGGMGVNVPGMGANDDRGNNLQSGMRPAGVAGPGGPPGGGPPPGGPGGGPPPGGGPGGGGPGGPGGGFGGGLAGPGGPGAPGAFGPETMRPGWQGRPNAMAFGNGRRDPRRMYMGMASFSLDNSIWDARTFSVTGADLNKPAYATARGMVMFGSPLRIPKLVSADKHILFTLDFQFQRNRTGTTSDPVNVPTALERSADFSQTLSGGKLVTIYDPTTGLPFPGNRIPASRISASALALLQYYPTPNLPFSSQNYQTSWTGVNNSHNLNSRIANVKLDSKDRMNGGIGYQGSNSTSPNLFGFTDTGSGRGIHANLAWSRSFSATLINNVQYNFSRNRQLSSPYFADGDNVAAELGIAGTSQNPLNWGAPNLNFTNYAGLTDGNYSLSRTQTGSVGDNLLLIRGSHNFTFGGEYRRQQFNQLSDTNGRGTYSFNGLATSLLVDGVAASGTGYDLADFLLGTPTTASIRYGNPDKYFRGSGYGFFVNDDWRVRTNFSIVVGLRWDYATPVTELYNRMVNLDISGGFSAVEAVLAGRTAALINPDRNNFSPRLGFAWRPITNRSMVVRGGYGVYYNTSVYNIIAANLAQQAPFAQTLSVSNSAATPLSITNAFLLASSDSLTNTYAIDPNYRIGYAQTWTLSVQNDLPLGMFGTVGYLGTKGTRLDQQFIPNSVAPGAAESSLRHNFIYETSNGNSIYHAAQFQLIRRFRTGISAHAAYQFSKSIDNAGTGGRGQGNTPVAQDWLDLSAERGLSSFDSRHNLSLQVQYSTGMGVTGGTLVNGWRGALIKDWTISGNVTARSGNPFTATIGGNRSQVSGTAVANSVRADSTGLPVGASGLLFNTAAFAEPAAGTWGNAGRNTIPGPTTFYLNGSLGRVFRFGERRSADLQFQAQNLLNHVTITSWGTVLGAANYGLATNAAGMRTITANLTFRF